MKYSDKIESADYLCTVRFSKYSVRDMRKLQVTSENRKTHKPINHFTTAGQDCCKYDVKCSACFKELNK